MTISLRLSEEDEALIKTFASRHGVTISQLIRQIVIEKIEEEIDVKALREAIAEYDANPVTYTHEEVKALLEEE